MVTTFAAQAGIGIDLAEHRRHAQRLARSKTATGSPRDLHDLVVQRMGLPKTTRRSGLGNLTDRAGDLGGTMCVGPGEGGGTELEWRVPLPATAPRALWAPDPPRRPLAG